MNYTDKHKLLWFAPIRTASRAVGCVLRHLEFIDGVTGRSLERAAHNHVLASPRGKSDYGLICNVRNPYTRMASVYTWAKPGVPFRKWVDTAVEPWIAYEQALENRTFHPIRMESLADDLRKVDAVAEVLETRAEARADFTRYITENRFKAVDNFRSFYKSQYEIDAVKRCCARQFEMLGYSTDFEAAA
jgi:hypothetical protein